MLKFIIALSFAVQSFAAPAKKAEKPSAPPNKPKVCAQKMSGKKGKDRHLQVLKKLYKCQS